VQITLTAWDDLAVIVDTFRVDVLRVSYEPAQGTPVLCSLGGADITPRHLAVRISDFASTVTAHAAGGAQVDKSFAFVMKPGDTERLMLDIQGLDDAGTYHWVGLLDLLVDNQRKTVAVTSADGEPFVLHGKAADAARYGWSDGKWRPLSI